MWDELKPKQPPCSGMQFAEAPQFTDDQGTVADEIWSGPNDNYYDVTFDKNNNVLTKDKFFYPESSTAQEGQFSDRQFNDYNPVKGLKGVNTYNPEDAASANVASTTFVDVSRADRGKES